MTSNIEKEYHDLLCRMWEQLSEDTKDAFEPHEKFAYIYDVLAQASNRFLQNKLKDLELEKNQTN